MSNDDYSRWLQRARASDNYFRFMRLFIQFMSKLEALFLQDLINRAEIVRIKHKKGHRDYANKLRPDGFFECCVGFLTNPKYMPWSLDEQKRLFPLLENKKLITVKKFGIPAKRWVRINYRLIEERLDQYEQDDNGYDDQSVADDTHKRVAEATQWRGVPATLNNTPSGSNESNQSRTSLPRRCGSVRVSPEMNGHILPGQQATTAGPKHQEWANLLRSAVKGRRVPVNGRAAKWAHEFMLLDKQLQDEQRLAAALGWYCTHIGEPYVPQAYCGRAFRLKFAAVEQAMHRHARDSPAGTVTVCDEVDRVVEHLMMRRWPVTKDQVAAVAQIGHGNYLAWRKKVWAAMQASPNPRFERYCQYVLDSAESGFTHAKNWMEYQWHRLSAGNGRLDASHAFTPGHPKFRQWGLTVSNQFGGDGEKLWSQLQETVS